MLFLSRRSEMGRALLSGIFITVIFTTAIDEARAQRGHIVHIPMEGIRKPVLIVPEGTTKSSLPDLQNAQVVVVPQGAVVVVQPPVAEAGPNPDCTVAQEECANSCYLLPNNWPTYRECLIGLCKIQDQNCIEALIERRE
jgi:hypothetical protein